MTSSATTRNRLEKQGTGDNSNTWGTYLNSSIDLIDAALDGRTAFTLSGSKTLSSANYSPDESRERFLDITGGTGGTVTIPAVEKWYIVRNAASGDVVFTTGSGVTQTVKPGSLGLLVCDGTNIRAGVDQYYVNNQIAQAALTTVLPGQSGNNGKYLKTDGNSATWELVAVSDVATLSSSLSTLNSSVATKQDTLVSGTNLKTVGGNSLLGSGNITLGSLLRVTVFTSSGTWTKGANTAKVLAYGVGGGGGTFVSTSNDNSTGGAGSYSQELIDVSAVSTVSVTVGSGGSGVTSGTGGAGGSSSFGSYWTAGGGAGGAQFTPGTGGTASGGDMNINGGKNTVFGSSRGVDAFFGPHPAPGASANCYGSSAAEGNGANGIVIVMEFA